MLASAPPPANPAASLALLGAIIAAFRKNLPIGGWLFFFFWGAFVGCGVTVLSQFGDRLHLLPAEWKDQTKYLFHLLSLGPRVCSLLLVVAVSIVLIARREWRWVEVLRSTLAAYLISQLATVLIDAFFFPSALGAAIAGLFYPIAFLLYSLYSTRVVRVFQKRDWEVQSVGTGRSQ
jgi:hypothetical protein